VNLFTATTTLGKSFNNYSRRNLRRSNRNAYLDAKLLEIADVLLKVDDALRQELEMLLSVLLRERTASDNL